MVTSYYGLVGKVLYTEPIKLDKWTFVLVHTVWSGMCKWMHVGDVTTWNQVCDGEQITCVLKASPHGTQVRNRLLPHCLTYQIFPSV